MKVRMAEDRAEIVVVGAGLAGIAAASFAAARGLKVVLVGWSRGEMVFASGALDLLGVYPVERKTQWLDPWAGVEALIAACPDHPYARLGMDGIREAWREFLGFLEKERPLYQGWPEHNAILPTAAGTLKRSFRVPETMWGGVVGLKENRRALLIDFEGMKDFSAAQIAEGLKENWPSLDAARIPFPAPFPGPDRYNLLMAEALESADVRAKLAEAVRPLAAGFDRIGLPAILGIREPWKVQADLESRIGVPVFEIPTLPPSVPGQRLVALTDRLLAACGVELMLGRRVLRIETEGKRCVRVVVGDENYKKAIEVRGVLLASGRFIGGGLAADLNGIHEALLDLPVHQPESRELWHREDFFDPRGHAINRAGLSGDAACRPLGRNGACAFENLFAAGSILAHQDWMREKCGAGVALASAYHAVRSFCEIA